MTDPRGAAFVELVAVMDKLRVQCAWDAKQTHRSLVEYLLEETHETIEAIETDDGDALLEELGDLLLQIVFHSRIAQEAEPGWDIDTVTREIIAKLVRRHPHVFGTESDFAHLADVGASDEELLTRNWATIKVHEKGRTAALAGIPPTLPALSWAQKSWRRAEAASVAPPTPRPVDVRDLSDLGDQLLALVITAETRGWDAESALRERVRRLHHDVGDVEALEPTVGG
jgi:XTP/dITP diphosphohydrolase